MADKRFWNQLEYSASGRLAASADQGLNRFWVDGFLPETIKDTRAGVDVEGIAWVGEGSRAQHQYRFVASIPQNLLTGAREVFVIDTMHLDEGRCQLELTVSKAAQHAAPEPSPSAAVLESSETMNTSPESETPADCGAR